MISSKTSSLYFPGIIFLQNTEHVLFGLLSCTIDADSSAMLTLIKLLLMSELSPHIQPLNSDGSGVHFATNCPIPIIPSESNTFGLKVAVYMNVSRSVNMSVSNLNWLVRDIKFISGMLFVLMPVPMKLPMMSSDYYSGTFDRISISLGRTI